MAKAKKKSIDVRKAADLLDLKEEIAKHPLTIILIHADYCGHCQTYKERVWNSLADMPAESRKNGLASIHYDQLENTAFANAKIKGYPSVILVGKKDMAEFKDEDEEGATTNAMPMAAANDAALMESLVSKDEPSTLMGKLNTMSKNVDEGDASTSSDESIRLDPEAESLRNIESAKLKRSLKTAKLSTNVSNNRIMPPDASADVLDSQVASEESQGTEFVPEEVPNNSPRAGKGSAVGGSLYQSLLAATRAAAPAAALTAAAVVLSKKQRRRRTAKKSKAGKKRGSRRNSRS